MNSRIDRLLLRVVVYLWCVVCVGQPAAAEEFTQDLRGRSYDGRYFRPFGSHTHRAIRPDFRGLRICPVDPDSRLPVGLVCRFGVRGDFEITLAFEILQVPKPAGGNGAGLSIYVGSTSLTQDAATLGRFTRPDGEQVFLCHRAYTAPGEERRHAGKREPTTAGSGHLRLVRKGTVLSYQVAESGRSAFRELYQSEWTGEDLDTVRIAADNGGSPAFIDVLLKGVSIRADDFGAPRRVPQPARWSLSMTIALTSIVLASGGFWFWRRWRRGHP